MRTKQIIITQNSVEQLIQNISKIIEIDNNVVTLKDKIIEDLKPKDRKETSVCENDDGSISEDFILSNVEMDKIKLDIIAKNKV